MGKKTKKNNNKRKQRQKGGGASSSSSSSSLSSSLLSSNFVTEAGPGCFIARKDRPSDWIIEWEDIDPREFIGENDGNGNGDGDGIPDVAIDTEEKTLSFCNIDNCTKVAYITVYETTVLGSNGQELVQGITTNNDGVTTPCVTFIVLCPPHTFVHLCYLHVPDNKDITETQIESDVREWNKHPNPSDEHPMALRFPLGSIQKNKNGQDNDGDDDNGNDDENETSFLCTQGVGGELTHFFSGNLHAIDFRCPIGTPLIAVADGTVVESKDTNKLTGVAVSNLFQWNSIMIQVDTTTNSTSSTSSSASSSSTAGPLFVEYVHIQKSFVNVGDVVKCGDTIGTSGSIGFSPEPHLHFSAFRSSNPEAPTVRVKFQAKHDDKFITFMPRAGLYYNTNGEQTNKKIKQDNTTQDNTKVYETV